MEKFQVISMKHLTQYGLVMPYDNIDLDQDWLR